MICKRVISLLRLTLIVIVLHLIMTKESESRNTTQATRDRIQSLLLTSSTHSIVNHWDNNETNSQSPNVSQEKPTMDLLLGLRSPEKTPEASASQKNTTLFGGKHTLLEPQLRDNMSTGDENQISKTDLDAESNTNSLNSVLNTSRLESWLSFDNFLSRIANFTQANKEKNSEWSTYLEKEAKKVYSRFNFNSYDVKVEFLRFNYVQLLKTVLTKEKVKSEQLFPPVPGISAACYVHLMDWFDGVARWKNRTEKPDQEDMKWTLKMFDSFGRPSAGLINGVLQLEGDYDQCLDIHPYVPAGTVDSKGTVRGEVVFSTRYCRAEIPVGPHYTLGLPKEVNTFWTEKQSFYLNFNWGICVPDSCHSEDIKAFLNKGTLAALQLEVHKVTCFDEPSLSEDPGAVATIVILVTFLILVTGCSVLDIYRLHGPWFRWHHKGNLQEKKPEKDTILLNHYCNRAFEMDIPSPDVVGQLDSCQHSQQNAAVEEDAVELPGSGSLASKVPKPKSIVEDLINRLSFYSNFLRLIDADTTRETFTCIQGMKVVSMAWIVAGHCYTYGGLLDEANIIFKNTAELVIRSSSLTFHLVGSAHLAVDTFFVISGFLVMYITLRTMETRAKPMFWLTFFLHRFWRLTPMYMMVLAVGTNLYDHIVRGPLKADNFEEFEECKDKWWSHFFYVNNFYKPDKKCMTWSWYMSVDMQLYIISPVFIYATYKNRKVGVAMLVSLCFVGAASAFVAEYLNGGQFVLMDLRFLEYWSYVYSMPYTRVAAYGIGMLLAVNMYYNPEQKPMSTPVVIILWVTSLSVGVFLVLINHIQWKMNSDLWLPWQQSLYEALVRPTWALCVAWVIYACHNGHGGIANSILSWKPFLVLSRLTYAVYLLHPLVILFVIYSRRTTIYLHPAYISMVYNYIGNLSLTYLLAVIFSLTFEVPMLALERLILQRH
ncbi:nose resistant to fluoxetine protein 6 [Biomphalaria glabrata]|nr:nose resistant to fluoxetine protein 6-like [Biomphalaria glabrata]